MGLRDLKSFLEVMSSGCQRPLVKNKGPRAFSGGPRQVSVQMNCWRQEIPAVKSSSGPYVK